MDTIQRALPRYGLAVLLSTVLPLAFSLLTISRAKIESGVSLVYCSITTFPLPTYHWTRRLKRQRDKTTFAVSDAMRLAPTTADRPYIYDEHADHLSDEAAFVLSNSCI